MIWQNPLAWIGLVAIAVPVLIHLLSRQAARVQKFPTLRFLDVTKLVAPRRAKLVDLLLLFVRCAVIAAAVAALAQPFLLTEARRSAMGRALARVIIVDTSASMAAVRDSALREGDRLAAEATASVVVRTAVPGAGLAGAAAWLATRDARREIVVLSDFQAGSVDVADLRPVAAEIGVRMVRLGLPGLGTSGTTIRRIGADQADQTVTLTGNRTDVEWVVRPVQSAADTSLIFLGSARELGRARAALRAATALGYDIAPPSHRVALVFPQAPERAALLRDARPLSQPWMGDVLVALGSDQRAFDSAAVVTIAGQERLALFMRVDPGSLASAATMSVLLRELHAAPLLAEREPARIPDDVLARWTREPADAVARRGDANESDGRWLWVVALVLLAIETWVRRAPRSV